MRIAAVGAGFPAHYYNQATLIAEMKRVWGGHFHNPARLEQLHTNVLVGGRHLALPMERYAKLTSFKEANDAYITVATDVGESAVREALKRAGLVPHDIDHIFFVSVTGLATPSIDARLVNRLGLRSDIKRTPIFGLGCVAGAAGIARATDYVKAYPDQVALLVSVELCSLTLQREDMSVANLIASGLFGDGGAAVVITGAQRASSGPRVVATRSVFYSDSEDVMGWQFTEKGFRVVLSPRVPAMAYNLRGDVQRFLSDHGLQTQDIGSYICHSGGPKILAAVEEALGLSREALALSWKSLAEVGNLSSASVLLVLREAMASPPPAGTYGLLLAMGPGFCYELVLLQWCMTRLYTFIIALHDLLERLVEMRVSDRNAARAFARGGIEYGTRHFRVMALMHAAFLMACLWEVVVLERPFAPWVGFPALGVVAVAQALRYWAVSTLGDRWNVRVIVVPGAPAVRRGPYRFLRHPNYIAVIMEIMALPLVHGAYLTAITFSIANIIVLAVRIRCEEQALTRHCYYAETFGLETS